jgi:hypothetical protein
LEKVIPFKLIIGLLVKKIYINIAICMYEFICGAVPFEDADDPMKVYLSVINE